MRVNFIFNRIQHHAGRSGYDQLLRYLDGRVPVDNIPGEIPRYIPMGVMKWLAGRASMEWYGPWSFSLEAGAARRLLAHRDQICHVLYGENDYRFLGSVAPLLRRRGGRIVASYHQPPSIFERVGPPGKALRRLDAIVALGSNQLEYFASYVGEERVFVVPLGVDTDAYRPRERNGSAGVRCLFVGQWLRDFAVLGGVIERVRKAVPSVRFTVITDPGAAEGFSALDNVTAVTGVSDDELLEAYQTADVFILPLTDCTANCALLEALACGAPVVATDVGGIRDYVDESCALLTPPGDADAMADAVLELAGDEGLRAELARRSRQRALAFNWATVADRMVDVYRMVAA